MLPGLSKARMEWMPMALFNNPATAEQIRNRLVQAGFNARISERSWLQRLWFVRKGEAGISVEVPGDQFEKAENLLLEWDAAEGALREAIRCPECKSLRVQYPQFARHSFLTNFMLGLASALGVVEKEYYCEDCHFAWPKEGTRPRRDRPHLAPYYFISGVEQTTLPTLPQPKASESARKV
jgi:hypothetical protein